MKIALAQAISKNNDIKANLLTLHKYVIRAKEAGADSVFFGEAFLQGFGALSFNYETDKAIALSSQSPELYFLSRLATDKRIAIGFGFYRQEKEKIFSSYLVYEANGSTLVLYDRFSSGWKTKTADSHYASGTGIKGFNLNGHYFGLALCGDLFDDEILSSVQSEKYDGYIWPVYLSWDEKRWTRELPIYAKRASSIDAETYLIGSISSSPKAVGPAAVFASGKILCSIPFGVEGLLIKEHQ